MAETIYKGKVSSFWKLLSNTRIEVPIIQRDYAQGRKSEHEIRDNFLNALHLSLSQLKPIKLDFIYGSIKNGILQPLDGQQRLTTLFLLHWFALKKDVKDINSYQNVLSNFSYETRISSREFCSALVKNDFDFVDNKKTLREKIINSSWFVLSWEKDPTIDAMLRTIEDLYIKFSGIDNLWEKLSSDDCLIQFYHVELRNIGLTDDLYIKMNARGKLLSPFENFKAGFQKFINDNRWEQNTMFINSFAFKIDTDWTDLLWNHRKGNSIDEAFMRFASTIAMIRLSLERTENRMTILTSLQENPNNLRPEVISAKGFYYLNDCFDLYVKADKLKLDLKLGFNLWQHKPADTILTALVIEDNLSSNLQKNSASYTQKVLFFAQTEYLRLVPEFDPSRFQEWMKVIRNIISRGDVTKFGDRPALVRSPQTFDGMINLVAELSQGCSNILGHLSTMISTKSAFAKEQVEEEILKARLIGGDVNYQPIIDELEENNLLRGRIAFPLYVSGYEKGNENFDLNQLKRVSDVFKKYFNVEGELPSNFRRALLTIEDNGEYKYYNYWWSFWNVVNAEKRCLIDRYRELEYFIDTAQKIYLKKLILQLMVDDLDTIINKFQPPAGMPNWKVRLIKDSNLLSQYCKSNYIAISQNGESCYLLKSIRPRDSNGCEEIS